MKLGIKFCRDNAKQPVYASKGAACFDIFAANTERVMVEKGKPVIVPTGLKFEIPEGQVLEIYSRSGHGFKNNIRLSNAVGIIDSDYVGEVMVKLILDEVAINEDGMALDFWVNPGDRIAQAKLVPVEQVEFEVVEELKQTERGEGGFGSTGSK